MRILVAIAVASHKLGTALWPFGSKPRNLARDLRRQSTEVYWRRREKSQSRALRLIALRYRLALFAAAARDNTSILQRTLLEAFRGLFVGGLLLGAAFAVEWYSAGSRWPWLVPPEADAPPFGAFPALAVQVSASLLGFYLASVSIVISTAYADVSADVRALVLESTLARIYLRLVGMAIGAGLALVLLGSTAVPYGYLSVGVYAFLVVLSAWALFKLAVGAFDLLNPIDLSREPLRLLYRTIARIDSKGLMRNEAAAAALAHTANMNLQILAELLQRTKGRSSINRSGIAQMTEVLLSLVRVYAEKKHRLAPTSGWFIRTAEYARWAEVSYSETSIALKTQTPLQPRLEPETDWLEKRSAELVAAAIEMCVSGGDRDDALRITRAVARTSYSLARNYRVDDAVTFSALVRDRCWAIQSGSQAAVAINAEPPLFLSSLLLGWAHAMANWPEEIRSVVADTKWDSKRTKSVEIKGPQRVWIAAQQLLQEVMAEREIEGRRVTRDWYLRYALTEASIVALREFADRLPDLLDAFFRPVLSNPSPEVRAMAAAQCLEAQAKAQLVVKAIHLAPKRFEGLRMGNDLPTVEEFSDLGDRVDDYRWIILRHAAETLSELEPDRLKFSPDLFGHIWFTLLHHVEEAIANGNTEFVTHASRHLIPAAFRFEAYLLSTYHPPTYRTTATTVDPVVDVLELSGLAMIYAAIRDDQSEFAVKQAWDEYMGTVANPEQLAKHILDVLEIAQGGLSMGISSRSVARTEWGQHVANRIREAGFARPTYIPFEDPPPWNAPPLIKTLGVDEYGESILVTPRAIFVAENIVPLAGVSDDDLKNFRSLSFYYESLTRHANDDPPGDDDDAAPENTHEGDDVP